MFLKHSLVSGLLLALLLPVAAHAANLTTSSHAHDGQPTPQLQLNAGKKWSTDAALRQGMAAIHLQLAEAMPTVHEHKPSPDELQALAAGIEQQVATIVSNCRLEAKADAQLHMVIAQLLEGSAQLAGKQPGSNPQQGIMTVLAALDSYIRYFDDPELAHSLQH